VLLGVRMVGSHVSELISEAVLELGPGLTVVTGAAQYGCSSRQRSICL